MKFIFSFLTAISLFLMAANAQDIKIMTFNIHGGSSLDPDPMPPTGKDVKIRNTAAAIKASNPDIAILQEVNNFTTWAGNMNQADSLANLTGMNAYFGRQRYTAGAYGEAGILMLSKYPIREKMLFPLPSADISMGIPRALVIIGVDIRGQRIYVVGAHFDNDPANRSVQAAATVKIIKALPYPVILGGDLNDFPGTEPMNKMGEALKPGCSKCPFTMRWDNPNRTIDYIMFNDKLLQSYYVASYETVYTNVSDHMPVLATLSSFKSPDLLSWNLSSPNSVGTETSVNATNINVGLETSTLTRGEGLNNLRSVARGFAAGANFASSSSLIDTAIAIDKKMFLAFNVRVKPGKKLSLTSLFYKARISSGGAKTWYWTYSIDNVKFHRISVPIRLDTATATEGEVQPEMALAHIPALQDITSTRTIYFRVYLSGANTITGSTALGRSSTDPLAADRYSLSLRGKIVDDTYQPIVAWQFGTPVATGDEQNQVASVVAEGLSAAVLKRGPGLRNTNAGGDPIVLHRAFVAGATVQTAANSVADTAAAVANKLYYSFKISPLYGRQVSLSLLRARVRASDGAAKTWYWKYSLDGIVFNKLAAPYYNPSTTDGVDMPDIDLSKIVGLQQVPGGKTIYLRLYIQGSNATTGSSGIGRSASGSEADYVLSVGGKVDKHYHTPMLGWQFFDPQTAGSETTINSTVTATGLEISKLKRGPGFRTTSANGSQINLPRAFVAGAVVATTAQVYADTASAIANHLYFSFEIKPKTNHKAYLSKLNARVRSSSGGAQLWYWKYSLDSITFHKLAEPYYNSNTTTEGIQQHQIDLSIYPALQNIGSHQKIYLRAYMQGANDDTGSSGFGRSVAIDDYVLSVEGAVEKMIGEKNIVAWQFGQPESNGGEIEQPASEAAEGFYQSILKRGSNLRNTIYSDNTTKISLPRAFAAGAKIASSATSKADTAFAVANNLFFSFEIKPLPGHKTSLSKLNARIRASNDGAKTWYWKYSLVNDFDKSTFNKLADSYYNPSTSGEVQMPEVDLSTIPELQNLAFGKAVYFRLYIQGANDNTSTSSLGRSATGTSDDYVLSVEGKIVTTLPLPIMHPWTETANQLLAETGNHLPLVDGVLPVRLVSFSGKANLNSIRLSWKTLTETANSKFELWQVHPGKTSALVGIIPSQGDSKYAQLYYFDDYKYSNGVNYYQLNQIDHDGNQQRSNIISVNAGKLKTLQVHSSAGKLTVFISSPDSEKCTLSVFDMSGKRRTTASVQLTPGENRYILDGLFVPGTYVVKLESQSGHLSKKTSVAN